MRKKQLEQINRDRSIALSRRGGLSLSKIGKSFGMSVEGVRQAAKRGEARLAEEQVALRKIEGLVSR